MTTLDVDRLAKVLRLLSSPMEGEALAAARKATEIVRTSGLDWLQVLKPASIIRIVQVQERQPPDVERALSSVEKIRKSGIPLSTREMEFIESLENRLRRYHMAPTEKQAAWLDDIAARADRAQGRPPSGASSFWP